MVENIESLFYLTRPIYITTQKIYKKTGRYNVDRMLWYREIYSDNIHRINDSTRIGDAMIQSLEHDGYVFYFIKEIKKNEHNPLVFWVNMLPTNENHLKCIDDGIITHGASNKDVYRLKYNGKFYKAVHVGNVLTRYTENHKFIPLNTKAAELLYIDVQKYLDGIQDSIKFKVSFIGDHAIVYRVLK